MLGPRLVQEVELVENVGVWPREELVGLLFVQGLVDGPVQRDHWHHLVLMFERKDMKMVVDDGEVTGQENYQLHLLLLKTTNIKDVTFFKPYNFSDSEFPLLKSVWTNVF